MEVFYLMSFNKKKSFVGFKLFLILLAIFLLLGSGCYPSKKESIPDPSTTTYVLKYKPSFFYRLTGNVNTLLCEIDFTKGEELRSFQINSDATRISQSNDGTIFLPFRGNFFRGYKQILRIPSRGETASLWVKPLSIEPLQVIETATCYWIAFDRILKPAKEIIPTMSEYQQGGFEIYSKTPVPKFIQFLRLGEDDYISDISVSSDKNTFYLAIETASEKDFITGKRVSLKHWKSKIGIINTEKREFKTIDVSPIIETITGIQETERKLYVCALRDPKNRNLKEEIPNNQVFVFDKKTFQLIKTIQTDYFPRKVVFSPEDHRIFIYHQAGFGGSIAMVTVINELTDKIEGRFRLEGLSEIKYVGHHRLLLLCSNKIAVINTKTLKKETVLKGSYWVVADKA